MVTDFCKKHGITGVEFQCRIGTEQFYGGYDQNGDYVSIVWDLKTDAVRIKGAGENGDNNN